MSRQQVTEAEQRLGMTAKKLSGNDASERDLADLKPKLTKEVLRMVVED
jgi:hypothetical protein